MQLLEILCLYLERKQTILIDISSLFHFISVTRQTRRTFQHFQVSDCFVKIKKNPQAELLSALHAPARIVSRRGTACESDINERSEEVSKNNRPARITARRATYATASAPPEIIPPVTRNTFNRISNQHHDQEENDFDIDQRTNITLPHVATHASHYITTQPSTTVPLQTAVATPAENRSEVDDHSSFASAMDSGGESLIEVEESISGRAAIPFDPRYTSRANRANETITSSAATTSVGLNDYYGAQSTWNCALNRSGLTNADPRLSRPTIALAAGRSLNMYRRDLLGSENIVYSARNSARAPAPTARMDGYNGEQSSLNTGQNIGMVPPLTPMRPITSDQQSISMMHLYGLEQSSIRSSNNNLPVAPKPKEVLRDRQAHSENNARPLPYVSSVSPILHGNEESAEPIPNILTNPAEFMAYVNKKIERLFPN